MGRIILSGWHTQMESRRVSVGHVLVNSDTRNQADLELLRHDLKAIKNMGRAGGHARRGVLMNT